MAFTNNRYYTIYRTFDFSSRCGQEYRITIYKSGGSGDVPGVLGGNPILRRDRSGNIMGTSLEILVESNVEGDMTEYWTSDPFLYKVVVRRLNDDGWRGVLFEGFLVPELYAEPEVSVPYDVLLTATDGLGELKRHKFNAKPAQTLDDLLTDVLSYTGLSKPISYLYNFQCDALLGWNVEPGHIFDRVYYDFGYLNGESCYDVLQKVLKTLNATIYQRGGYWDIVQEGALADRIAEYASGLAELNFEPAAFGEQGDIVPVPTIVNDDWYPIGHIERTFQPARNMIKITAPDNYAESILVASKFTTSGGWSEYNGVGHRTVGKADYCPILYNRTSRISQTLVFERPSGREMEFIISAYREAKPQYPTELIDVNVNIRARGEDGATYYYATESNRNPNPTYPEKNAIIIKGSAPAEYQQIKLVMTGKNTPSNQQRASFGLPLTYTDGTRMISITVEIAKGPLSSGLSSDVAPVITECTLRPAKDAIMKGYELVADLGNNAREPLEKVESMIPLYEMDEAYRDCGAEMICGFPFYSENTSAPWKDRNNVIDGFSTGDGNVAPYDIILMRDYARCNGLPRVKRSGTLNVPPYKGTLGRYYEIPVVVRDSMDGIYYMLREFTFDLYEDELDVELISIPAATVTIVNEDKIIIE